MNLHESSPEFLDACREALATEQAQSLAETNQWAHLDKPQVHIDWDILYRELALLVDHSLPSSPEVQSLMARHLSIASRFYPPSQKAYIGLALFYDENPEMKAYHQGYHPNMVAFLAEAMFICANTTL